MWSLPTLMPAASNRARSEGILGLWQVLSAAAEPLTVPAGPTLSRALQSPTLAVNRVLSTKVISRRVVPPVVISPLMCFS